MCPVAYQCAAGRRTDILHDRHRHCCGNLLELAGMVGLHMRPLCYDLVRMGTIYYTPVVGGILFATCSVSLVMRDVIGIIGDVDPINLHTGDIAAEANLIGLTSHPVVGVVRILNCCRMPFLAHQYPIEIRITFGVRAVCLCQWLSPIIGIGATLDVAAHSILEIRRALRCLKPQPYIVPAGLIRATNTLQRGMELSQQTDNR